MQNEQVMELLNGSTMESQSGEARMELQDGWQRKMNLSQGDIRL